jgi:L-asparaginase/beta-aspartyl-peptidase (threonine type)
MTVEHDVALALHGGAGARPDVDYALEIEHMRGLVVLARGRLLAGESALDVAVETVEALESSGLYVAGRGASPNLQGEYELDACVMDGATQRAGAVAALQGFKSPIHAAALVMEQTPHVMLAGSGAASFAHAQGLEPIETQADWFGKSRRAAAPSASLAHGTVGCVVRDRAGRLAAATSTGGVFGKLPGRVGDSPVPGSGAWADQTVAVSCTGQGEYFLRTAAAAQVAFRMRFGGQSLAEAAWATLAEIKVLGGDGGLIAVDADGNVVAPFVSAGMKRAMLYPDGRIACEVFAPDRPND